MKTIEKRLAEQLWENCIHRYAGSFTLTQQKRVIKDMANFLRRQKLEWELGYLIGRRLRGRRNEN